jgi:hypothetical protein
LLHSSTPQASALTRSSRGLDTVLVFDVSQTMNASGLAHAKVAANKFMDGVEATARDHNLRENVAIVVFGRSSIVLLPLTDQYAVVRSKISSIRVRP